MYAIFDDNNKFVDFTDVVPRVPNKRYFLYMVGEVKDPDIHSAYLDDKVAKVYCDGYKLIAKLESVCILKRIYYAIRKFRGIL